MAAKPAFSPLVSMMFGLRGDSSEKILPVAIWLPAARRPPPFEGFAALSIDEWLDDPVIPTSAKHLSRRELISVVRDQDGGAHSDPDAKLAKSPDYVELVNAFPASKQSAIEIVGHTTFAWDLLPPVAMPILRQISHELLSAIWSQSDIRELFDLPSLVCMFRGTELQGVFVPEGYPELGFIYGHRATVVPRKKMTRP